MGKFKKENTFSCITTHLKEKHPANAGGAGPIAGRGTGIPAGRMVQPKD